MHPEAITEGTELIHREKGTIYEAVDSHEAGQSNPYRWIIKAVDEEGIRYNFPAEWVAMNLSTRDGEPIENIAG